MSASKTRYVRCKECRQWIWAYQGKQFCSRSCASRYQHSHKPGRPSKRMAAVESELRVVVHSTLGKAA